MVIENEKEERGMSGKFRFSGKAEIQHLNTRKEGPEDDKELAVDVKFSVRAVEKLIWRPFHHPVPECLDKNLNNLSL